ncbi:dihydrofolate reductase family protein [Dietzia natronolimnaea]|uniref:dihydrofolate reductase family protein n=1 Tax=Dietzia natronolimnaea TaxID=161920 RepID=UPI0015F99DD2|nr:dihydrofolate reductase family protein [Dietzia natronolimnaea]MBB1039674.1 dihydrofolate reductase [Dietzia natronolimnaea]
MSRTITAHMFSTLNGVVEHADHWQFDSFGPEEMQGMAEMTGKTTDLVLGRTLWEEWSGYWPGAQDPFAEWVNPVRKHVLTSTLTGELPWNSVIVPGDAAGYLEQLRQEPGGDIAIAGGIETIRRLVLAGLVDELTLTIHPVITGEGRRLFDDSVPTTRMRLLDSTQTQAGNIIATYALRSDTADA